MGTPGAALTDAGAPKRTQVWAAGRSRRIDSRVGFVADFERGRAVRTGRGRLVERDGVRGGASESAASRGDGDAAVASIP